MLRRALPALLTRTKSKQSQFSIALFPLPCMYTYLGVSSEQASGKPLSLLHGTRRQELREVWLQLPRETPAFTVPTRLREERFVLTAEPIFYRSGGGGGGGGGSSLGVNSPAGCGSVGGSGGSIGGPGTPVLTALVTLSEHVRVPTWRNLLPSLL